MRFDSLLWNKELRGLGRPGFEAVTAVLKQVGKETEVLCNLAPLNYEESFDSFRARFFLEGTPEEIKVFMELFKRMAAERGWEV